MNSIRLILVRHGNTFEAHEKPTQVGSRTDLPLTEKGRSQAEQMALFFESKKIRPAAIYRGPLKRQIETARIIGQFFRTDDQLEPILSEIDYGPWEGLTSEEIGAKWPQAYADWTEEARWAETVFGGKPPLKAIELWLIHLRKTYMPGDTVIAISSNGLIRFFYSFLKTEWERLVQNRQMEKLKVKTGHFCDLLLFDDRLEVNSWNAAPKFSSANETI